MTTKKTRPNKNSYDLQFRPTSYWGDPAQMLIANIKGEHRKRWVMEHIEQGNIDEIQEWMLDESLSPEARELVGKLDPVFMGGEYLPDCRENEVEIARVSLASATGDVITIRARREGDLIGYFVGDEYETEYRVTPAEPSIT